MSRPCHFFNTAAGCNRGNQCKFAHSSPSPSARPLSPSTSDATAPPQRTPRSSGNKHYPPGVCKYFWEQGRCTREFNCRHAHIQRADGPSTPTPAAPSPLPDNMARSGTVSQRNTPFLMEQVLSKMSGGGIDGFFPHDSSSLSPSEAHNNLKLYLADNFRFKSTFEVYGFLRPLNSATASNAGWVRHAMFIVAKYVKNVLNRLPDRRRWSSKSRMVTTIWIIDDANSTLASSSFCKPWPLYVMIRTFL